VALVSASAASAAIRQQRELLWQNKTRNGKLIRESLETTVWTTAKLKLADFLKERMEGRKKIAPPLFSEAVELFKRELESDTASSRKAKNTGCGASKDLNGLGRAFGRCASTK
jgi:predicted metalloprotease with PDZ domain